MKTKSPQTPTKLNASERLFLSSVGNRTLHFGASLNDDELDSRTLPRMIFRSPQKKNVTEEQAEEIPKVFVEPPILARQAKQSKENSGDHDAEDEKLNKLTVKQLKERYRQLVERYRNGAETFSKLEKKRVRMTAQLDQLRRQVKDLECEQNIVEAEFERLGLGASNSGGSSPRSGRQEASE